eukprot:364248-Chlamydomonas_euryale.AAC.4
MPASAAAPTPPHDSSYHTPVRMMVVCNSRLWLHSGLDPHQLPACYVYDWMFGALSTQTWACCTDLFAMSETVRQNNDSCRTPKKAAYQQQ